MSEFSEHNGISVDLDDLIEFYESRMTREKAQAILAAWTEKPKCDYVDQHWSPTELSIDGKFTTEELEAIVWCKRNDINVQDLANGL